MNESFRNRTADGLVTVGAFSSAALLWLAGPPFSLWLLAFVALVPWLHLIDIDVISSRRQLVVIWLASTCYWLVTLQGLRHAHPAMYACWFALAAYLAVYHVAFVATSARLIRNRFDPVLVVPLVWVTLEWIRNYLLTGISAAMLGHTLADQPLLIQIADLQGTYTVSFLIAIVNVALYQVGKVALRRQSWRNAAVSILCALVLLTATVAYGFHRLAQSVTKPLATFALIQRAEKVVYEQSYERELEIFQNYARQTVSSLASADEKVDVVVWPESMFTGGTPWMTVAENAVVPQTPDGSTASMTSDEFKLRIEEQQRYFLDRANYVQQGILRETGSDKPPELIVGCGVVRYADDPEVYSGVVQIDAENRLIRWYGKTHLVMFGEYVPVLPWIPGLRSLVPPGMGLQTGDGPKTMLVKETTVVPNICIETAVERVTVNHVSELIQRGRTPDVVVTVTNDGWFDDSSILDHHLRCAQLVAVGCRRPILSAANNGPTAWIDSCGKIVDRLAVGDNGVLIATPAKDERTSLYTRIGDWPVRTLALLCGILWFLARRSDKADGTETETDVHPPFSS